LISSATAATNQTEIIYSVFVAGKPVLATTASEDMQLLTQDEVNLVMEKLVYIKAERETAQTHLFLYKKSKFF
jgi:hypothetical protein